VRHSSDFLSPIRVLVTAIAVALALSSAVSALGASSATLRVGVDPRVELFSLIYRLAGNPQQSHGRRFHHTIRR